MGISNNFSSPAHPQVNEQVEVTNYTLVRNLKKHLDDKKWAWVEELSGVLWAYRTTVRTPTRETPFALVYGVEAIISIKVGISSYRINHFNPSDNDRLIRMGLGLVEELWDAAKARNITY